MLATVMGQLAEKSAGKYIIIEINTDEQYSDEDSKGWQDLVGNNGVDLNNGFPQVLVYRAKTYKDVIVGFYKIDRYNKAIDDASKPENGTLASNQ